MVTSRKDVTIWLCCFLNLQWCNTTSTNVWGYNIIILLLVLLWLHDRIDVNIVAYVCMYYVRIYKYIFRAWVYTYVQINVLECTVCNYVHSNTSFIIYSRANIAMESRFPNLNCTSTVPYRNRTYRLLRSYFIISVRTVRIIFLTL